MKVEGLSTTTLSYALANSEAEAQRLALQNRIVGSITERLLRQAGIRNGMRVLDLGSGIGDVSFCAAELVGPSGAVVGVDFNEDFILLARKRAEEAGLAQVSFVHSSIQNFEAREEFDAVIGRYILLHQVDPASVVRHATSMVRSSGIVGFHEIASHIPPLSLPELKLIHLYHKWVTAALRLSGAQFDAAGRMLGIFREAGLPVPTLYCETPVGGGRGSPLYPWIASTLRSFMPKIIEFRIATAEEIEINTFQERLELAAISSNAQLVMNPQFTGWVQKP